MAKDKKGSLIKQLYDKRNEIRVAEEVSKKLKQDYDVLQFALIDLLKQDNLELARHEGITASIGTTDIAHVVDWEKFYRYLHKNKAFYLLQKRVSDKIYREEVESRKGRLIPGVETYTKTSLRLSAPKK